MNLFRVDCPTAPKMSQSALETESNFINQFDNLPQLSRQNKSTSLKYKDKFVFTLMSS